MVESPTSPSPVSLNVTTNGAASAVGASPLERLDNLIKGSNQTTEASVHSKVATATAGCSTIKGWSFDYHTDTKQVWLCLKGLSLATIKMYIYLTCMSTSDHGKWEKPPPLN